MQSLKAAQCAKENNATEQLDTVEVQMKIPMWHWMRFLSMGKAKRVSAFFIHHSASKRIYKLKIDSKTMNIGAVGSMRNVKNAIGVARHVLENTQHTFLVGEGATNFAIQMGFANESLTTTHSKQLWDEWKSNRCQPNFWAVSKNIFHISIHGANQRC